MRAETENDTMRIRKNKEISGFYDRAECSPEAER